MPNEEEIEISLEIPEEEKPPPDIVAYYECGDNITPFSQSQSEDNDIQSQPNASEHSGLLMAQLNTRQQT